ncbi:FeS assembly ATPase SufC [Peptoanaerobacter stomatis]|uniref:FeS assembly ATPase SufC n=1 Tax=Peptoanaerobacter stomatis TaxID=796937 RepID=J5U4U2_9FIRM|nr:Fe-S cluster assembly ATPase SufC [Peptoanaerobacter stomatis]EJU19799.1 FeS assembly ATPase SufC [Peptoanaerobacter stomatis]NWO24621.1 Fe-S cluster assembly ATPase SufC [Peptostreptococcaceae bacterium oral taxon 081]
MGKLLEIKNLSASVEDKNILKNINLTVNAGEIHVLMGPNGAGKSTLMNVIMEHPKYTVTEGQIIFDGEDITDSRTDERAKKGIFMSFQNPEEIQGVDVEEFLKEALNSQGKDYGSSLKFHKELVKKMDSLKIDNSYAQRYVNVGFSGGEKKKNEMLQMSILNPKLALLDETDSGLDVDAVKIVSEAIKDFFDETKAIIIITHHKEILKNVKADYVHVLKDGELIRTSDATLIDKIEENGYENISNL